MNIDTINEATEQAALEAIFLLVGEMHLNNRKPDEYILNFCLGRAEMFKRPLRIFIDSLGGHAGSFYLIKNIVGKYPHVKIETEVAPSGDAQSAAALVYLLGDVRIAYPTSSFLFHNTIGGEKTHASLKETIKKSKRVANQIGFDPGLATGKNNGIIQSFFRERCNVSEEVTENLFSQDRDMTAHEAFDWGIVTEIRNSKKETRAWYRLLYPESEH